MEAEAEDDADLLRAHRAGNPHAFTRLYDRYDRPCFRFIARMLGPAHRSAAEDLHQEAWLAVARNAAAFDPARASFRAWLFTIARNRVWDHFRRLKVAVLASVDADEAGMISDDSPTPFDRLQSRELAERLVAAVEALPLEQRSAFILFADAGLTLEEIAEATGVGPETAKSRLRYARARLREALAGERSDHV
jgi:RNA polymerase sigma factor (sigma-70 family)